LLGEEARFIGRHKNWNLLLCVRAAQSQGSWRSQGPERSGVHFSP
jgi:hypothetical protein